MIIISFTIFESGTRAKAGEVNENFNGVMYSVLMNRMENDLTGQAQIDTSIVSDNFNCACGRYETINTINNTSVFDTDFYTNLTTSTINPYTYNTLYYCTCILNTTANFSCNYQNGCYSVGVQIRGGTTTDCSGCFNFCYCLSNGNLNINNYKIVDVCFYFCQHTHGGVASEASGAYCICFPNLCCSGTTCEYGGFHVCNIHCICMCFIRKCDNCYTQYINGVCISDINVTGCEITNIGCAKGYASSRCNYNSYSCSHFITKINRIKTDNTFIKNNIIEYLNIKNATMLVANAELPTGNSITYDIYNQSNTKLLEGAEPNKIYSLSSTTDCSFYAVINQNVECNLCDPQKLYAYALKFF